MPLPLRSPAPEQLCAHCKDLLKRCRAAVARRPVPRRAPPGAKRARERLARRSAAYAENARGFFGACGSSFGVYCPYRQN